MEKIKMKIKINSICVYKSPQLRKVFHMFIEMKSYLIYPLEFISFVEFLAKWYVQRCEDINKKWILNFTFSNPNDLFPMLLFFLNFKLFHFDNFGTYLKNNYQRKPFTKYQKKVFKDFDRFFIAFLFFCCQYKMHIEKKIFILNCIFFFHYLKKWLKPLDFTKKGKDFFTLWLNLNIKLLPFTFLLFLTSKIFPTIKAFFPFSLFFSQIPFLNALFLLLLILYILKVYTSFVFREVIYIYQAIFFIKNPWIFFLHIIKFPFLLVLSITCLKLFLGYFSIKYPDFIFLGLILFSNLRFIFMITLGIRLQHLFTPLNREFLNFFEKRADKQRESFWRKQDRKKSRKTGITINKNNLYNFLRRKDQELGYNNTFFSSLIIFWFILVPIKIFSFFYKPSLKGLSFELHPILFVPIFWFILLPFQIYIIIYTKIRNILIKASKKLYDFPTTKKII